MDKHTHTFRRIVIHSLLGFHSLANKSNVSSVAIQNVSVENVIGLDEWPSKEKKKNAIQSRLLSR